MKNQPKIIRIVTSPHWDWFAFAGLLIGSQVGWVAGVCSIIWVFSIMARYYTPKS